VSQAIWGFFGVLLGALIGAGASIWATYWVTTRAERNARAREEDQQWAATRAAARLLDVDFLLIQKALQRILADEFYRRSVVDDLKIGTWDEAKKLLVLALPIDRWERVVDAVKELKALGPTFWLPAEGFSQPISASSRDPLIAALQSIAGARSALHEMGLDAAGQKQIAPGNETRVD
jgi:hypothetical protein